MKNINNHSQAINDHSQVIYVNCYNSEVHLYSSLGILLDTILERMADKLYIMIIINLNISLL